MINSLCGLSASVTAGQLKTTARGAAPRHRQGPIDDGSNSHGVQSVQSHARRTARGRHCCPALLRETAFAPLGVAPPPQPSASKADPIPDRRRAGITPRVSISHSSPSAWASTSPAGPTSSQAIRPKKPAIPPSSTKACGGHGSSGKQALCSSESSVPNTLAAADATDIGDSGSRQIIAKRAGSGPWPS